MKTLFRFFAERHLVANLFTLLVIVLGVGSALRLQRDTFPEVDFGELIISTRYPGASPEEVELKITNKIEDELAEVSGIKSFSSYSIENFSLVDVLIDPDESDQEKIKRRIRTAVDRVADLPREVDAKPDVVEINSSVFEIIEVGVAGDVPYPALREAARKLEWRLERVPGVSRVERFGWRAREIQVEVQPDALETLQLSLFDIHHAIRARNVRASGGNFESYVGEKNIVTLAQFDDPLEVEDVVVRSSFTGPLIRIRDLAEVRDGFEDDSTLSHMNGISAISFVAYKKDAADIVRTVDAIRDVVEAERARLPEGVSVHIANDMSKYVRNRFGIVFNNGMIGLVFVLLVLTVFLQFRIAFWVAMGIPVTLLGVVFLLPLFDVFLDSITLTAMILILGIVVDDAIIISESIYQHNLDGADPVEAAVLGIHRVFSPVLTTLLTTFIAFCPMFFMPGIMGKFVWVTPLAISLALIVSLLEVVIALPAHIASALRHRSRSRRGGEARRSDWFTPVRRGFSSMMVRLLRVRYLLLFVFLALFAGAIHYARTSIDFVLFPSKGADAVILEVRLPRGSSLQATADKMKEVEAVLETLLPGELDSFVTRVGKGNPHSVFPQEEDHAAHVQISLTPFTTRLRTADEIVEDLRTKMDAIAGLDQVLFIVDSGGPPVGRPITLRVTGIDDDLRRALTADILSRLQAIDGVKDLDRDDKTGKEEIRILPDYEAMARLGLTVAEVAATVRAAYDGEVVTRVRYGDEDVDFRVRLAPTARKDLAFLEGLSIPNQQGRLIALKSVATLEISPGQSMVAHFDGDRSVTITGDVDKAIIPPAQAIARALDGLELERDYPGMDLQVGGEAEETQSSVNDLIVIMAIAIVGIYFLLVLLFGSVTQPALVMAAIPFGMTGVVVAFGLHGEDFGFLAMQGLIGLTGVVVNDSLVLVDHLNKLIREHPSTPLRTLVAQGAGDRLRAIVVTTLTTVAGLLPLAYGLGGADPYMSPMALSLGFGLLFATPLTITIIPCLYLIQHDAVRLGRWLARRPQPEPAP